MELERQLPEAGSENLTSEGGTEACQQCPSAAAVHSLSFSSTPDTSRKPWEQLQVFAELLLMHSQLKSEVSPGAWFPNEPFVVQFQQHTCVLLQNIYQNHVQGK